MKKVNKRIKNAILQGTMFNILVMIAMLGVLFYYIVPSIIAIVEQQEELYALEQDKKSILKQGVPFKEFKAFYKKSPDGEDPYVKSLLENLDEEFYNSHFINTTKTTYKEFFDDQRNYTIEKKSSEEFKERDATINNILPAYSNSSSLEGVISDFNFISYIETLLFTFNLQTNDSIGVGTLTPLKRPSAEEKDKNISTEASIFYIPLQLELVWQKKDVLDFIHFIENVGAINIEEWSIVSHSDKVIKKPLEGDIRTKDYNIYNNQLASIENITMRDYIDSSSQPSDNNMIDFVRQTQGREKFEIDIKMHFYVTGLPDYKIESFIENTLESFKKLKQKISSSTAKNRKTSRNVKSGNVLFSINTVSSLNTIVAEMENKVSFLKKSFHKDKANMSKHYTDALEINHQIEKIQSVYEKNQEVIDIFVRTK